MTASKLTTALLVGVSVVAFAAQASAQADPQREAAIGRCIRQAHLQYPGESADDHKNRTYAYSACMTAAGFSG